MATVYLAQDLKHDRKVALKVLKPELAAVLGADRFIVEIKTTAALQHPHILPLFDSGEADGFLYYVMPFIDGETLRAKLDRETQLGVEESVKIARDVADALQYAHDHGVIHRDIKPENILLANGRPMVADFGIALAVSAAAGGRMTETGLSLGTPHYMSPEQATAEKEISARSDVYSLGSVLYEMLTGEPPHMGTSAQQIIMKIITEPAAPVTKLRKTVPANVAAAVAQALEKLPADRFDSAARFGEALGNPAFAAAHAAPSGTRAYDTRRWLSDRRTLAILGFAAVAVVAALVLARARTTPAHLPEVMRLTIEPDAALADFAIYEDSDGPPEVAPDGRSVAIAGQVSDTGQVGEQRGETPDARTRLLIRRFDQFETRVIPGGGRMPFYSPDGRWLAYFRGGALWRVSVDGGEPAPVANLTSFDWNVSGYAWHPRGSIVITTDKGLWSLPATGGRPEKIVASDSTRREFFTNPVPLDDDRVLIEVLLAGRPTRLAAVSLRGGERTLLPEGILAPAMIAGDVIMFGTDPVQAARFDRRKLALASAPIPLSGIPSGARLSAGGSLAWLDNASQAYEPVWVSTAGVETSLGMAPGLYRWPRLSPDGMMLAIGTRGPNDRGSSLWTTNLRTGTRVRLGAGVGHTEPVWTPDGLRVAFSSGIPPHAGILIQRADASQPPDTLYPGPHAAWPTGFSPDRATLAFYGAMAPDPNDISFVNVADHAVRRLSRPGSQKGGRFSPDGRWFSYESTESGRSEVYVQPWPALDAKWVVSRDGGREPIWSHDGRQLFYRSGIQVFAVDVTPGSSFTSSPARAVVRGRWFSDPYGDESWDVAPDGRFLMLRPAGGSRAQVKVVRNWTTEFQAREGAR